MTEPETEPGTPDRAKMLPGVAAIGLWMFVLCVIGLVGVTRHALPPVELVFCAAFAVAGQGLLRLRRWGWAMTAAAVLFSATREIWAVVKGHQVGLVVMVAINLILFLYLVRPEVRERLK
jgi:uncharacterized membrane protein (DUF2068 family)